MNFHSVLLAAADTFHLGRVDKASFPTQTLMEMLIQGIENREVICGSREEPEDIDKWHGFRYCPENPSDVAESQSKITWVNLNLVGTIDLQWLPPIVLSLKVMKTKLSGSLNLTALPWSIQFLTLSFNSFSGDVDLCYLPAEIKELDLSNNQLSGSLNLEQLPQSIHILHVHCNRFTGTLCLLYLPPSLDEIAVDENELSGAVDLTRLPVRMTGLWLGSNNFEGKTDFSQLPEGLQELQVSYTNLSGKIVVQNRTKCFNVVHSSVELIR